MDRLTDGDLTKFDMIYDRNYIECLNLLSYWRERDYQVENQNKKMQSQIARIGQR